MPSPSPSVSLGQALRIAGDFGVSLAVPAVVATLLGAFLDKKFGTTPWIMLILLVLAFVGSTRSLIQKAKQYAKDISSV